MSARGKDISISALRPVVVDGPHSDLCFVKVETNDPSVYGWGECSLPGKPAAVTGAIRDLEKLILGFDPCNIARCWQRMQRHAFWRGGPVLASATSGIDVALWDLRGKLLKMPIYELLGGAVRDRIRLYANIGASTSAEELRERALAALALGYTAVKLYPLPAVSPVESPATIRQVAASCEAVRDAIGDRDFAVDFHGRPTAGTATLLERAIRDTGPLWIEEPVAPGLDHGIARCAEKFTIPIAAGERCHSREDFLRLLGSRVVDVVQPDVSNAGGITAMVQMAALAELHGVAFAPHNPNGPVQSLASLHIAAHAQSFAILEHRLDIDGRMAKICDSAPEVGEDGHAPLPGAPGLGADVLLDAGSEPIVGNTVQSWIPESFRSDGSIGEW